MRSKGKGPLGIFLGGKEWPMPLHLQALEAAWIPVAL